MSSFVAIDFETANEDSDSACAVAVAAGRDGRLVGSWSSRIRPPTAQFTFTYVHKLAWEDVRAAPAFDEIWPTLCRWLNGADFVAAHHAPFDNRVLAACCRRFGLPPPAVPFQCTVQLARRQWSIYPTKLPDVCRRLGIPLRHHVVESDAEACARIVLAAEAAGWRWSPPPPEQRRSEPDHGLQVEEIG